MKKFVLVLCLIAITACGFAQDFRSAGQYEGYRDFNPNFQKKLSKYSKKHFELLQDGNTSEAAKFYESKIVPLKRKIKGVNKLPGFKIETAIYSYTGESNGIQMRFSFPAANEKERAISFNNLYFDLNLKPKMYLKVFESGETLNKVAVDSISGDHPNYIYAKGKASNRLVKIKFTGDLDGTIFKRGVLTLRLKNGKFVGAELFRQKKRFLGMMGYATTFAGFATNLKQAKKGVMLVDDSGGPLITSPELIFEASKKENRTGEAFKKIAAKQK
jgi:hypothetical protein